MEFLLNSIWLLVAVSAFRFWHAEKVGATASGRQHSNRFRVVALACALVLLFPVISLTDDLHAEQAPMEDSSRSVMKARSLTQGFLRAGGSRFAAVLTPAAYSAFPLCLFHGTVPLVATPLHCHPPFSERDGRSPPFSA
jgi:hypothetical protein